MRGVVKAILYAEKIIKPLFDVFSAISGMKHGVYM